MATSTDAPVSADDPSLLNLLSGASLQEVDTFPFGVIGFDREEIVAVYNAEESRRSGLLTERVVGLRFFTEVAPCINNPLVAERFRTEPVLDASTDYVFTFMMKPTPVRLRMLADPDVELRYLVVTDGAQS